MKINDLSNEQKLRWMFWPRQSTVCGGNDCICGQGSFDLGICKDYALISKEIDWPVPSNANVGETFYVSVLMQECDFNHYSTTNSYPATVANIFIDHTSGNIYIYIYIYIYIINIKTFYKLIFYVTPYHRLNS